MEPDYPSPSTTLIDSARSPHRTPRPLRWMNGAVHWITAFVLLFAFISNGETTRAMIKPVAMTGEVKLGVIVGFLFLFRFIWVYSRFTGSGRWVRSSDQLPRSTIRRLNDWGIYLGVAASVVSGLLIAFLRPGAEIVPGRRGFLTNRPMLNAAIISHVHITTVLEWLCVVHAVYGGWVWLIKRSRWGRIAESWMDQMMTSADRAGVPKVIMQRFRL